MLRTFLGSTFSSCFKGHTQKMRIERYIYLYRKVVVVGFKGHTQKMRIERRIVDTATNYLNFCFKGHTQKMRIERRLASFVSICARMFQRSYSENED